MLINILRINWLFWKTNENSHYASWLMILEINVEKPWSAEVNQINLKTDTIEKYTVFLTCQMRNHTNFTIKLSFMARKCNWHLKFHISRHFSILHFRTNFLWISIFCCWFSFFSWFVCSLFSNNFISQVEITPFKFGKYTFWRFIFV